MNEMNQIFLRQVDKEGCESARNAVISAIYHDGSDTTERDRRRCK